MDSLAAWSGSRRRAPSRGLPTRSWVHPVVFGAVRSGSAGRTQVARGSVAEIGRVFGRGNAVDHRAGHTARQRFGQGVQAGGAKPGSPQMALLRRSQASGR